MSRQTNANGVIAVITKDERRINRWVSGELTGGYKFQAKVFDEGSQYGIQNGRVSKLDIRHYGRVIVNYDRGWDLKPKSPEDKAAYKRVMSALNSLDRVAEVEKPKDLLAKIEENKEKVCHNPSDSKKKTRGDELC